MKRRLLLMVAAGTLIAAAVGAAGGAALFAMAHSIFGAPVLPSDGVWLGTMFAFPLGAAIGVAWAVEGFRKPGTSDDFGA